jgi:hypothetical protein
VGEPAEASSGAPEGFRLGTSRTEFHPPSQSDHSERRLTRYQRRQKSSRWLIQAAREAAGYEPHPGGVVDLETGEIRSLRAVDSDWVRPPRAARCRWRLGDGVGVHHSEGTAHWSGIERCASIWACPVCAAVVRAERAAEIQRAVELHQGRGGSLVFVTLTMRHSVDDPLKVTLNAAIKGWQDLLRGKAWKTHQERYGVTGYVRAVEITHGRENGWHPHIHALFFVDQPLTEEETGQWETSMFDRWSRYVVKHGGGMPTALRGIDVRAADKDGTVVAQYLSKIQEAPPEPKRQAIGNELARGDMKTGRGRHGRMPFELLDTSSKRDAALWVEYVEATSGRRAITWSNKLRESLDLGEERTDEEVVEDAEQDTLRVMIPGPVYDMARNRPKVLTEWLGLAEAKSYRQLANVTDGYLFKKKPPLKSRRTDKTPKGQT